MMHILHVIHQYFPDHVGGTEHYARSLALEQQQRGHEVTIFCRQDGNGQDLEWESLDGLRVCRAINGPFTSAGRFRSTLGDRFLAESLVRVADETQADLIHVHHLMGLPANALKKIDPTVPLVVTLHDYWWVCANAQLITNYEGRVCDGPRWWLNCARCGLTRGGIDGAWPLAPFVAPLFGWRAAVLRGLIPQVAAWITPTDFVRSWHTKQGFPSERTYVVAHGIELPPASPEQAFEQDSQRANHFAYIGGLSPQKGVHVLMDAFNELPDSARLTVAGDETAFPDYCGDLHRRARHPGIRLVGRLDREGVWQVLAQADVLVVPSLWYETASLVVQEAFAAGVPVVAADHGALAERVRDGVDGLLVPPGDVAALSRTLRRLMEESGLLARLRGGIQPVVTVAENAQQVEAIYQQAFDKGQSR